MRNIDAKLGLLDFHLDLGHISSGQSAQVVFYGSVFKKEKRPCRARGTYCILQAARLAHVLNQMFHRVSENVSKFLTAKYAAECIKFAMTMTVILDKKRQGLEVDVSHRALL